MAIFEGSKNGPDGREGMTLIGEEAYFHGVLSVKGSLRVEGSVEGDISDAVLVEVGKKGRIKGNIAAEALSVAGEVDGDVVATRSIELLAGSSLRGNIRAPSLRVEEGAHFDGSSAMSDSDEHRPSGRARAADSRAVEQSS